MERRRGGVLNVGSVAGFLPGPGMAVYYATKAHVLSFTEALAEELAGTGLTVTRLCPGATETNFGQVARGLEDTTAKTGKMTAQAVAQYGHDAFRRGNCWRFRAGGTVCLSCWSGFCRAGWCEKWSNATIAPTNRISSGTPFIADPPKEAGQGKISP